MTFAKIKDALDRLNRALTPYPFKELGWAARAIEREVFIHGASQEVADRIQKRFPDLLVVYRSDAVRAFARRRGDA